MFLTDSSCLWVGEVCVVSRFRWDKSPSSKFTNQLGLSDVQPPALDGGAELRQPGIEQQGMSFTQLLTQDLPTAEQLDSAVMDAMGSWSP